MKKVSILLMTYNCADVIRKTLQSIEMQDYPLMELIISDGVSTDGTLEIIRKCAKASKYEYFLVSEKDGGLYDALNRCVRRANGDYLLVMNDQFLRKNAVSKLVAATEEEGCDGAHSDLIYATDEKVIRYWHMGKGSIMSGWLPGHPSLLLKKEVYRKYGLYNIDYKIAADYEFMIRILKRGGVRLAYVPDILVRMYYGGTSTAGLDRYEKSFMEGVRAVKANKVSLAYMINTLRTIRVLLQFIVPSTVRSAWENR